MKKGLYLILNTIMDDKFLHPNNTFIVSTGFADAELDRYRYYNTLASALTDAGRGTLILSYDNRESYTPKDGVQVMFLREQSSETQADYVYVIEGLGEGYQQTGKYYSDFLKATQDTSDDTVIALIGDHTLTTTYRANVNVKVLTGATLRFRHTNPDYYAVHTGWNFYGEAGASIVLENQGQLINMNIYGKPTFTVGNKNGEFNNWDFRVEESIRCSIDVGVWNCYELMHMDEIYGYLNLNADIVYKKGTTTQFIGLQMQTAEDRIIVRAGHSTAGILMESGAYTPAHATIVDSRIIVGNDEGAISVYENNEPPNLKVVNCNLINTNNNAGACGINNYSGNGNAVNITLVNTIIKTTHASSKSIIVDTANGCTGVVTAVNSWANKAVGTDVSQVIASGFTVDSNVKA